MTFVFYRLRTTQDPEDLVENAIMWKHLKDLYGDRIAPLNQSENPPSMSDVIFGDHTPRGCLLNRTSSVFKYWEDPAFLGTANRSFKVCSWDEMLAEVGRLHGEGKDAFIKSVVTKQMTMHVPRGMNPAGGLNGWGYSFCDEKSPSLLVQEYVPFRHEIRCFIIDRTFITLGYCDPNKTPLDYFDKDKPYPFKSYPITRSAQVAVRNLATSIGKKMKYKDAVIDIGLFYPKGPKPTLHTIEFNPMIPGQVGLYDCNAKALAYAIYKSKLEDRVQKYQDPISFVRNSQGNATNKLPKD